MNTNDQYGKRLAKRPNLEPSEVIQDIPMACADEDSAVEFLEHQRWGDTPACVHCGSIEVYKMTSADGGRSKRYLWRCRDCRQQYTVRVGTVFEESRLPLRHWCYAFWRASTSKKGVSALEIMRQCQISYKSALFLMHRIRFAMAPSVNAPKLGGNGGIVEADETYVGGKPRYKGNNKRGRGTKKQPVFAVVERGGEVRTRVVADVTGATLKQVVHMSKTIQQVISEYEVSIASMESQIRSLKERVNWLCEADGSTPIYDLGDAPARVTAKGLRIQVDQFASDRLGKAIRRYLEMRRSADPSNGPAKLDDIREALLSGGFSFRGKDPVQALSISLGKSTHTFRRLNDGYFGLQEWYGVVRPKKTVDDDDDDFDGDDEPESSSTPISSPSSEGGVK